MRDLAPPSARLRLRYQLLTFAAIRIVLNTGHRLVYPFLPVLARGLGVDLRAMALAVSARSMLGLLGPVVGSVSDNVGQRRAMVAALLLFGIGFALVTPLPLYPVFVLALMLGSLAKIVFDSSMQAYLGERIVYARRGLAIAVTEMGWSLASLVGLPLVGLVMATRGWQDVFIWLAALGIGCAILLRLILPPDALEGRPRGAALQNLRAVAVRRAAVAGLAVSLLISTANEVINIVFGVWLENAFALQVAALGASAVVIGAAELSGEGLVAGLTDRLGKRRAVGLGILASLASSLLLPWIGDTLAGALVGLFLVYVTFEFALVSGIALMTELAPEARATAMASNISAHALGRVLGAMLGSSLFVSGIALNSIASAGLYVAAFAVLVVFVRE